MKETSANVNQENEERKYYLSEFSYDDGEYEITFNIIDIDFNRQTITVAITCAGKITQDTFDLLRDNNNKANQIISYFIYCRLVNDTLLIRLGLY